MGRLFDIQRPMPEIWEERYAVAIAELVVTRGVALEVFNAAELPMRRDELASVLMDKTLADTGWRTVHRAVRRFDGWRDFLTEDVLFLNLSRIIDEVMVPARKAWQVETGGSVG